MSESERDGRKIDLTVDVPGTPEEVWAAIATGPGITSWFVPTEVEERDGGRVRQSFGEMGTSEGSVRSWEPPERVVFEGAGSTGQPLAFEWTVQALDGGTCRVRLVNSGFGEGEEWDGDYDGMSEGWPLFLENLRLHLSHFRSQHADAAVPMAMDEGPNERAWSSLCSTLGVSPGLVAGDTITLPISADESWHGRVEKAAAKEAMRHYVVLLDDPAATGFLAAEGKGDQVAVSAYLYFYGAESASLAGRWSQAFAQRYGLRDEGA